MLTESSRAVGTDLPQIEGQAASSASVELPALASSTQVRPGVSRIGCTAGLEGEGSSGFCRVQVPSTFGRCCTRSPSPVPTVCASGPPARPVPYGTTRTTTLFVLA